jgi:hypothetical protein
MEPLYDLPPGYFLNPSNAPNPLMDLYQSGLEMRQPDAREQMQYALAQQVANRKPISQQLLDLVTPSRPTTWSTFPGDALMALMALPAGRGLGPGGALRSASEDALYLVPKRWNRVFNPEDVAQTENAKAFSIVNNNRKEVARAAISRDPDSPNPHVDWIGRPGSEFSYLVTRDLSDFAGSLGTSQIRSLLRELGRHYPGAEEVSGFRVSGSKPGRGITVPIR